MVDTTQFLVFKSDPLDQPINVDSKNATMVPDGSSGARTHEQVSATGSPHGKYDQAGANVFRFMTELNDALFFILSEKNLEHRNADFFEQLEQSFLILQAGILTGKIWRQGIRIELRVKSEKFTTPQQQRLLRTITETIELNNQLLEENKIDHIKTVTLSFGAEIDAHKEAGSKLVIRTGIETETHSISPRGKHRFSGMIESDSPFISISTGTLFSEMDDAQAANLLARRARVTIDKKAQAYSTEEATAFASTLAQYQLNFEFGAEDASVDIVCEHPDEAITAIRNQVSTNSLAVLEETQEHDHFQPSIRIIPAPPGMRFNFCRYKRVILGGQASADYAVIPAGTMGEARFYQSGDATESAEIMLSLLQNLDATAELGGSTRSKLSINPDTGRFFANLIRNSCERFKQNAQILKENGLSLLPSDEEEGLSEAEIAEHFVFDAKVSAKRLLNYTLISTWVSQTEGITDEEQDTIEELILFIWYIDHFFDNKRIDDAVKTNLVDALSNEQSMPSELAALPSIAVIDTIKEKLKMTPHIWTMVVRLIEVMGTERSTQHSTIECYLENNHPSIGAAVVLKVLDAGDELNENDCAIINQYARILNDINTGAKETSKQNSLNFKNKTELLAIIQSMEEDKLNPMIKRLKNKKLASALHRFTTLGRAIYLTEDGFTGSTIQLLKDYVLSYPHGSKDPLNI